MYLDLTWMFIAIVVAVVATIFYFIFQRAYQWWWWTTSKPPAQVKSGDWVLLRNGETAKLQTSYDDGTWLVATPAFSDFQSIIRISVQEMRPF